MINKAQESTNIRVSLKTKAELESRGSYGETMDQIIQRLIFQADNGEVKLKETKQNKKASGKL